MESANKKILTMCFMLAGLLAAFVFRVLLQSVSPATSGALARALTSDFVVHILPVLIGFGVFLYLQLTKSIVSWADDVVNEIKKVVWPSRKDTVAMTIVVIVMCGISACVIWLFDVASAFFVNYLVTL
jgi:preprotein translocase subunit SecE